MKSFDLPLFTVDSVLFTVHEGQLQVLVVNRAIEPYQGSWALPGGYVDIKQDNSVEDTALRKLKEKTGVKPSYLEQLQVFSGEKRDPRGFSVTVAYYALIGHQDADTFINTVSEATWLPVNQLSDYQLAFDHNNIIEVAIERLRQKALYSMVPVYCLPKQFTVADLKNVIEVIIDKPIQRKTLIRRIEATSMFEEIEEKIKTGRRPATQYRLKEGSDVHHFERNLS